MVNVFNLILEAAALFALWPLRNIWQKMFLVGMTIFSLVYPFIPTNDYIYWYSYWGCKSVNLILLSFMLESMIEKEMKERYYQVELWSTTLLILINTLTMNSWWYESGLTDSKMTLMFTIISGFSLLLGIGTWISKRTLVSFGAMCWPLVYMIHGILLNKMRLDWLPYMSLIPLTIWSVSRYLPWVKKEKGYQPTVDNCSKAGTHGGSNLVTEQL